MRSANIALFMACLLPLALVGCGPTYTYSAESVDAVVVDNDSGRPLAGVNVVAYWELHGGGLTGDSLPCGAANLEEAVTDKDGKFHIPAWGPFESRCDMPDGYPYIYLFKPGFDYKRLSNATTTGTPISLSVSDWNGKTVVLKRNTDMDLTKNGIPSYAADFGGLNSELRIFTINFPKECNWKKIPNMLRSIAAQQEQFKASGNNIGTITTEMISADAFLQQTAPQCGSPKAFIEGLEQ